MWFSENDFRGCGIAFFFLCIFALAGLGLGIYELYRLVVWLWTHVSINWS